MSRMGWSALLLLAVPHAAVAQTWVPGRDLALIRRAVLHRSARDADTLLAAWQAHAHGVLRFASVMDHGGIPIERVIRADELEVEVYGEAPSRSKQIITAWRDTTFLPNHLVYHRDHLGIVANDFGATIRLGQGDEVRDVPHPLSPAGLDQYLFLVGDTLSLSGPSGLVRVVSIDVRPRDADAAGTVGTLYLDIDRAALVRFQFTFTPVSYRDPSVAGITVTLENALQSGARWLPWRQSIVIRRDTPLFDFPFESVIRADWTIDDYRLGIAPAADRFAGAWIDGPLAPSSTGPWPRPIVPLLDALPATTADVARVEQQASRALGGRMLDAMPRWRLHGDGVSDFLHVNRVEGVTPAIGTSVTLDRGVLLRMRGGYGVSDRTAIGSAEIAASDGATTWSATGERLVRDIADTPLISGVLNSLQTLSGVGDDGDYTLVTRAVAGVTIDHGQFRIRVTGGGEWTRSLPTRFTPLSGDLAANPALGAGAAAVLRASAALRRPSGAGWTIDAEAGRGDSAWVRVHAVAMGRIAMPSGELQATGEGGIGSAGLPGYRSFVLGGRSTLLGIPFRALGGRRMARVEVAWVLPLRLPTPPIPYSRYVHLASTLAPYLAAGVAGGDEPGLPWRGTGRIEPVAGLRLDLWGPLLRVETGVSIRTGRAAVTIDVHPDWWGLM